MKAIMPITTTVLKNITFTEYKSILLGRTSVEGTGNAVLTNLLSNQI